MPNNNEVNTNQTNNEPKKNMDQYKIMKSLDRNIQTMKEMFKDDDTVIYRQFQNQKFNKVKCCAVYVDGMIDNLILNQNLIKPIMENELFKDDDVLVDVIQSQVVVSDDVKKTSCIDDIAQGILYGDTVILIDGYKDVLVVNTKGWQTRAISEPDNERVLRGPREGFNECILTNLSLIRRRIKTNELKFKFRTFGTKTHTKACICYVDGLVDPKVLDEFNKRLDKIEIDGVIDANYIVEMIKDAPKSPFKTVGITEKPDAVAGKVLEGRIALIVDGTPTVITAPYLLIENFQASDDYYLNYYFSSIGRMLRLLGFLISISVPAIYVAFATFHREMIPTDLALSIMQAHQGIPFPTVIECILMLLIFEIIRETGIRMPLSIGQALSIVGALVIGQSAVEAKFISAPMVIIVAVTAITGLINPKIKGVTIIIRFLLLAASTILGLYGYVFMFIVFLIHIFSLRSFGVIYTSQLLSYNFKSAKDNFFRASWKYISTRPAFVWKNKIRKSKNA